MNEEKFCTKCDVSSYTVSIPEHQNLCEDCWLEENPRDEIELISDINVIEELEKIEERLNFKENNVDPETQDLIIELKEKLLKKFNLTPHNF